MDADQGIIAAGAINDGTTTDIDWVQSSSQGLYLHAKESGLCHAATWSALKEPSGAARLWDAEQVDCATVPSPAVQTLARAA